MIFVACSALIGGAVVAVDEQRQGGTVNIGETFTYKSGLALTVTAPKPYRPGNEFIVAKDENGYESTVTIANGTDKPISAALVTMNVTVNSTPAGRIVDEAIIATQDVAVGQQLTVPLRFKVKKGVAGPLQIAITGALNEPVFFNGTL